ncbi:MAG TPA: tetratricopeptide repeat protein, partial [Acidobacteriota bacterium]|nr:tetratricopeptide repeat protein [Acidobacteriota bacterium]
MKCRKLFFLIGVALLSAAPFVIAAGKVAEVPITTASAEAQDLFAKGQYMLDVGRVQEANALFHQAVKKDPAFSYAYLNMANSSASAQEFKEDLDLAMNNIAGKSNGEKLLIEAAQTFLGNDTRKRLELAQELVKQYPNSPRAWLNLGFMQATVNHHTEARQSFQKALDLDPKMLAGHLAMGFSYLFNDPKDFVKARDSMQKSIDLQPKEARCYENLGDTYRAMNQLEKARDAYSQAVTNDPALGTSMLKKGHINSFLGHIDEANADYDRAVAVAKGINKIFYAGFKGLVPVYAGNPKAAVAELSKIASSQNIPDSTPDQILGAKIATLTTALTIALHHNMIDESTRLLAELEAATRENDKRINSAEFTRQQEAGLLLFESRLAAGKGDYAAATAKAEENRKLVDIDTSPRKLEGYYGALGYIELAQKHYAKAIEYYRK